MMMAAATPLVPKEETNEKNSKVVTNKLAQFMHEARLCEVYTLRSAFV